MLAQNDHIYLHIKFLCVHKHLIAVNCCDLYTYIHVYLKVDNKYVYIYSPCCLPISLLSPVL